MGYSGSCDGKYNLESTVESILSVSCDTVTQVVHSCDYLFLQIQALKPSIYVGGNLYFTRHGMDAKIYLLN